MSDEVNRVRVLPWTGAHGQPCLLLTDGDGLASRLADRVESAQLGLAERLLGRTRDLLALGEARSGELGALTVQLADALSDALLIARSRGARLGADEPDLAEGGLAAPAPSREGRDVLTYRSPRLRAHGRLTLPGHDLASAPAARRHMRDTARAWGLPQGTADDLESIAGELVANALEHGDGHTITVAWTLGAETVTISVTDEGGYRTDSLPAPPRPPGPEQERGRGLLITDALASRWGTRQSGDGLTVWAEVFIGASSSNANA
ncbi:ATP-binding protein [Streptomyces violaceus]|uniref:ATP-binding protein n=1 Tax=Streptomyces violaceus TaxID=1936 RepID=UPI002E2BC1BE|nr:ATP-binding protein [Streptomyces violaceus]